ncbi:MAG TPA: NAD(P)-dependent oxidoreductase, partial [Candidatus Nitrosotenuis sp.]|nr:NAD(P)-dependent oxidoreductase [Candidatus Nitrosotenuis sp.]
GFSMRVLFYDPTHPEDEHWAGGQLCHRSELEPLLRQADFVSLHAPLTRETRHLIGARELALMKPTACLINTSRGPLVDERALVEALRRGHPAGAALDVFEDEPRLAPGLAELPNTVLVPHMASASRQTRERMALLAAENLLTALSGRLPEHAVNPEAWI